MVTTREYFYLVLVAEMVQEIKVTKEQRCHLLEKRKKTSGLEEKIKLKGYKAASYCPVKRAGRS